MDITAQQDVPIMRFELIIDGCNVGFVEYHLFDHIVVVTHTEVDPRWEGKGYGAKLVRQALEYFRGQKKHVVPVCGFFAHQIRRHSEYTDLVASGCRRIFNI